MMANYFSAFEILEASLRVRWVCGARTTVRRAFTTSYRSLPYAVVACASDGAVVFRASGEPERIITGNFAIFVPPNLPHEFISRKSYISRWAHMNCTFLGTRDVFSLFKIPNIFTGKVAETIGTFCGELAKPPDHSAVHPVIAACHRRVFGLNLVKLLLEAANEPTSENFLPDLLRIRPVLQSLELNLSSAITRDTLAALVNLSPTRFHTIFKGIMGEAPMQYVRKLRLQRARELLIMDSSLPVGEIAQLIGYPDQFHFSREFKKLFLTSPLRYRQQFKKADSFT